MTQLRRFLARHQRIALDSSIFIYSIDENPRYVDLATEVLQWVAKPGHHAVTSTVTVAEVLVKAYSVLDEQRAKKLFGLLSTYPNLNWIAADLGIANMAARLRGIYGMKTPDALQAATAVHATATAFVTNDSIFKRIPQFETLLLDSLI